MKIFLYGTLTDPAGFAYCAGRPLRAVPVPAVLPHYRRVLLRGARYHAGERRHAGPAASL